MLKFFGIKNLEGHPNCITVSRVKAILLSRWIFSIGGASAVEFLRSTGLSRPVLTLAVTIPLPIFRIKSYLQLLQVKILFVGR